MNGNREELLVAGRAALAEIQYAHDVAVETVVNEILRLTGERLLVRRPGVLDATYGDLAEMAEQTHRYTQAWRLICTQLQPDDPRRLGTVLKVVPAHVAHEIAGHLRAAGVLPAGGPTRSR